MKKKLCSVAHFLKKMTKYTTVCLVLIRLLTTLSYGETRAQEGLEKPISLEFQHITLREALIQIGQKADCKFIYSETVLPLESKVSLKVEKQKLGSVLNELLKPYHVIFSQTEKYVYIREKPKTGALLGQPAGTVTGLVTDALTGEPMVGVNITVKGTIQGTTTNAKGAYSLNVTNEDAILVFSFIGYTTEEIVLSSHTVIDVKLAPSVASLNQVVVVGYGEQQKKYVTGAIAQVKSQELSRYGGSSFAQQLTGRTAGVTINDASAQPGTDPQIIIRGIGTLTAGRNPLVVVDGFPLSEGSSFNTINPQDIESVEVLKDPASAAIYGSRAANGVILVTTKKGKTEKLNISFDAYTGFQERSDKVELMDAYQYALYSTEARDWSYVSKSPTTRNATDDRATRVLREGGASSVNLRDLRLNYLQPYLDQQPGLTNTDWLGAIFQKAKISSYNLAFSGGTAKSNYYASANYFDQDGIVIGTGYQRLSSTIKISSRLSDRLDFGLSINPSYARQAYMDNSSDRSLDPIGQAMIMYPFFSPYNADGSLAISQQIIANTPEDGALGENPVATMNMLKNNRTFFRSFGNTFLSLKLIDGLKYKLLLGGDYTNTFYDFFNPSTLGSYRTAAPKPATSSETDGSTTNYLIENTLNYNKTLGEHDLDVLVGYTFQKENGNTTLINGTGIPDNNVNNIAGATAYTVNANGYTWTQISYLARVQYTFKDRYLLSLATRRDGSSRFGQDNQWGDFPSVSAGWILSQESFFPASQILTFAKLRASWGKTGNNQIGSYGSIGLVTQDNYVYGNVLAPGYANATASNTRLSWETNTAYNLGVDLSFWNKLNLSANYYRSTTSDLLLNVPVPGQSGYNSYLQNMGKVRNNGIEVELAGNDIQLGPIKWGFNGNLATNHNEVLALAPGQQQIITGSNNSFRTRVGGPIAELYGYHITGVYKTQEEINNTPHLANALMGDYIVEDTDGNGKIDQNDKQGFGTYSPKLTYGLSSNFAYRNFEFSFAWAGVQGRKIFDNGIASMETGESFAMGDKYYFEHRYHPVDNPDGFLAQPTTNSGRAAWQGTLSSNAFFADASYLRLRNLQLAYNLPNALLAKVKGMKARVYISANNLLTLTSFRGFNPDATTGNVLTSGYSYTNYPVARSYMLGINLTF